MLKKNETKLSTSGSRHENHKILIDSLFNNFEELRNEEFAVDKLFTVKLSKLSILKNNQVVLFNNLTSNRNNGLAIYDKGIRQDKFLLTLNLVRRLDNELVDNDKVFHDGSRELTNCFIQIIVSGHTYYRERLKSGNLIAEKNNMNLIEMHRQMAIEDDKESLWIDAYINKQMIQSDFSKHKKFYHKTTKSFLKTFLFSNQEPLDQVNKMENDQRNGEPTPFIDHVLHCWDTRKVKKVLWEAAFDLYNRFIRENELGIRNYNDYGNFTKRINEENKYFNGKRKFPSLDEQIYLSQLKYSEYLKTDWWQEIRLAKQNQVGSCCELCNSTQRLQVHHRRYSKRGFESLSKDLILVCKKHHAMIHDIFPMED